jgi:hypothetical protein
VLAVESFHYAHTAKTRTGKGLSTETTVVVAFLFGRPCLRAQLGAARAGKAGARNLGLQALAAADL